jgi:hypothetical protein
VRQSNKAPQPLPMKASCRLPPQPMTADATGRMSQTDSLISHDGPAMGEEVLLCTLVRFKFKMQRNLHFLLPLALMES